MISWTGVSIYNAAIVGHSEYIKQGKDRFTRFVQAYDTRRAKYSLQKANLIKRKYMKKETAAQNIKNWHKSSIENEKTKELMSKPMHGQFHWDLGRPSVDKKSPWCSYVAQI